jgi:hypothetical protein
MRDRRKASSYGQTRKNTSAAIGYLDEMRGFWKLKEEALDSTL